MPSSLNLSRQIKTKLPSELVSLLHLAGRMARDRGQEIYLVGGAVRDLLLGRDNLDLDLAMEGDAIGLAAMLMENNPGKLTTHHRFNTARIQWPKWSVDIATCRTETYSRPGALPAVKPGSLDSDLRRRDFTVNAMAVHLRPDRYGEIVDLHGGVEDLERRLLRILHEGSFSDDATRILRGLRYEQRLGFRLERNTLRLLKRDVTMLDTISGDRVRHELELILKEEYPENILGRAVELGILFRLHPALEEDDQREQRFQKARNLTSPEPPPPGLYLVLLAYPLSAEDSEQLIARLRLPKTLAAAIRDTPHIKDRMDTLADPQLPPHRIYHLLHGHATLAITAVSLATGSAVARRHIHHYLDRLRYVRPALTGNDLLEMGAPPGPGIREILNKLLEARLDGEIKSKKDEVEVVRGLLI